MSAARRPSRYGRRAASIGVLVLLAACGGNASTTMPATTVTPIASAAGASDAPPACLDARLVFEPSSQRLLLAACLDQDDRESREGLWAWDGSAWELVADDGPVGHVVAAIAYDSARQALVRYGGIPLPEQSCVAETWEWSRAGGWERLDADPPPQCDHAKLAFHAATSTMVLVGGGDAETTLQPGTWSWDGEQWHQLSDRGPAPRAHHGITYDDAHGQTLLYGGYTGSQVFADLWAWDGASWTELEVAGEEPGPRSHHGLAAGAEGLLLFGGATGTSTFTSLSEATWYLTDGRWSRHDGPAPSARGLPSLGYDASRDVFVLYGGFTADGSELGDTWEWDGSWRCVDGC